MLTLTDSAEEAVKTIVSELETAADTAGLRMATETAGTNTEVKIGVADLPYDDDEVIDQDGARLFVEPRLASWLDDKLLDVRMRAGQVMFVIKDRDEDS